VDRTHRLRHAVHLRRVALYDRVGVRHDQGLIEPIRSNMVEPSAVTSVGRTAWVAEGQIGMLYDVKHPKLLKLPFDIVPVPVLLGVRP
jgi:hypothetical protein